MQTAADRQSQGLILSSLAKHYPGVGIVAEEVGKGVAMAIAHIWQFVAIWGLPIFGNVVRGTAHICQF